MNEEKELRMMKEFALLQSGQFVDLSEMLADRGFIEAEQILDGIEEAVALLREFLKGRVKS